MVGMPFRLQNDFRQYLLKVLPEYLASKFFLVWWPTYYDFVRLLPNLWKQNPIAKSPLTSRLPVCVCPFVYHQAIPSGLSPRCLGSWHLNRWFLFFANNVKTEEFKSLQLQGWLWFIKIMFYFYYLYKNLRVRVLP